MPNTTNHNVPLPTVGASADTWGGENNDAHQSWDTLTSGAQNTILGRVASGSGPMKQLTAVEARQALSASSPARSVLTGAGQFQLGLIRSAGAYIALSASSATLSSGVNIASVTWTDAGATLARVRVTFSAPMSSTTYQVHLTFESFTGDYPGIAGVFSGSKNTAYFDFAYQKNLNEFASISVFEGA